MCRAVNIYLGFPPRAAWIMRNHFDGAAAPPLLPISPPRPRIHTETLECFENRERLVRTGFHEPPPDAKSVASDWNPASSLPRK